MGNLVLNLAFNQQTVSPGYRYRDIEMPPKINTNGKDFKALEDVDSINNGLHNIFLWSPGERVLLPEFGLNLKQYLYEPVNESTANSIREYLQNAIVQWEPRVSVDNIEVTPFPDENMYRVQLEWSVDSVPNSSTQTFEWQLNRI